MPAHRTAYERHAPAPRLVERALAGADVATIPPKILHALVKHPLTDKGLEAFMADWQKTGQKIKE